MNDFFKRIKLTDHLKTELEVSKSDFINAFKNQIKPSDLGLFSDFSDVFSSSKKEYKGSIDNKEFLIKKKKRFFDTKMSFAKVHGTYREVGGKLIIDSEIKGFDTKMYFFFGFAIIFYLIFIGIVSFVDLDNESRFFILPFIFVHAVMMFGIPYFMMRRSVNKMKYDLEREFHYLSK